MQSIFRTRGEAAQRAGVTLLPAAAFFGGLADLLATAAADGSTSLDEVTVSVGLDSWHPTAGTRLTGQRNTARRMMRKQRRFEPIEEPQPRGRWRFPSPLGCQDVVMLSFSEMIILAHHLNADTIESWINLAPLRDVRDPATPPPQPSDDRRRSSQQFVMDALVRTGTQLHRATAFGRDIYAVSAAIVVEAAQKLIASEGASLAGVRSLGEVFKASAFLQALAPEALRVSYQNNAEPLLEKESAMG